MRLQAVIVHVDVGTQALSCAVHNASAAYCPVLIFAGLAPFTIDGELSGSRTEYVHWLQDAKEQRQIVSQYCRYTGEIRKGKNVKQMVSRAMQLATSDPPGPVCLTAGREVLEDKIESYTIEQAHWSAVSLTALPQNGVETIATLLQATIVHINIDPLKNNLNLWYINASKTYHADAATAFLQLQSYIASNEGFTPILASAAYLNRCAATKNAHHERLAALALAAADLKNPLALINSHYLGRRLRETLPQDTIWCLETVTNAMPITNQLQGAPGHLVNCGAGGLGWSGGVTLGGQLASDYLAGGNGKGKFVCEIVGNGTYMFGAPGTVYWIARRYNLATLTIVLSNNVIFLPVPAFYTKPRGLDDLVDQSVMRMLDNFGITLETSPRWNGLRRDP
ncbi:hypothetical protein BO82DRAFT_403341 [Aspergillus uvarum CBS 121591]|uniref:Uncharacterized protein n=1 Tax=Aspergillus uvarum CBS 121591 TaxID=1448315 RepID=A0A319CY34_9EURO|nr:hypothetical protein BO82DRAFT_403341 [Aspergillus uvarum CBS 121591]PYH80558.1 hypothetical protein BO82DRAFT_403341 [Aspergillus uvarum CBS 121591]